MPSKDKHITLNVKPSTIGFDGDERTLQFWDYDFDLVEQKITNFFLEPTKIKLQMTEEQIKKITDEVTKILLKKNADYGSASFDLGLNGNMVHIWDKTRRYRTLVENKDKAPNFESIEDTLRDIIGYAVIGLIILENENSSK